MANTRRSPAKTLCRIFLVIAFAVMTAAAFTFSTSAMNSAGQIVVLLDPGHATDASGGTRTSLHHEAWYNWKVAQACKSALEETGKFAVYLSHTDNYTDPSTLERGRAADRCNADVVISIHFDGNPNEKMNGVEAFTSVVPKYSKDALGELILDHLSADTGLYRRGLYQRFDTGTIDHIYYWSDVYNWDVPDDKSAGILSDYYGITTWSAKFGVPAVIVEHGFLTNEDDLAYANSEEHLKIMGKADAKAIIAYYTGHTHQWSQTRTTDYPTNCVFTGKASYHCTVCGCRKSTVSLTASTGSEHVYIVGEEKKATCTENGYTKYVCLYADNLAERGYDIDPERNGHSYKEISYATGHDYRVTVDREATHTEDGEYTQVCSKCGDTITEIRPAEGHSWGEIVHTDATCTEDGSDVRTCDVCGEQEITVLPAFGHSYTVVEDTTAACTEDGVHKEVCDTCGDTLTEITPATGHHYEEKSVRYADCEHDGERIYECTYCGDTRTEVLPALGHIWAQEVEKEPTAFHHGVMRYTCGHDKSHTYTEEIPRLLPQAALIGIGVSPILAIGIAVTGILVHIRCRKKKNADTSDTAIDEEAPPEAETERDDT